MLPRWNARTTPRDGMTYGVHAVAEYHRGAIPRYRAQQLSTGENVQ
jgi:hypothetical protein